MKASPTRSFTLFDGTSMIARGRLPETTLAARLRAEETNGRAALLLFDDADGRVVDLDLRRSAAEVEARALGLEAGPEAGKKEAGEEHTTADTTGKASANSPTAPALKRGPGRPRLGVTGREVTLLPRQWAWLAARPGGASVTLRKLVDAAMRADAEPHRRAKRQEAAYRFLTALAGDLPDYEEALRALFADSREDFRARMAGWPPDVRAHALLLGFGEESAPFGRDD
ncbi:MAG: DUF2239 family protein [Desulfovibrionaceae bacterium]